MDQLPCRCLTNECFFDQLAPRFECRTKLQASEVPTKDLQTDPTHKVRRETVLCQARSWFNNHEHCCILFPHNDGNHECICGSWSNSTTLKTNLQGQLNEESTKP